MNMEVLSLLPGLLVLCTIGSLFFPKTMAFWSKKESPSRLGTAIIYLFIFLLPQLMFTEIILYIKMI